MSLPTSDQLQALPWHFSVSGGDYPSNDAFLYAEELSEAQKQWIEGLRWKNAPEAAKPAVTATGGVIKTRFCHITNWDMKDKEDIVVKAVRETAKQRLQAVKDTIVSMPWKTGYFQRMITAKMSASLKHDFSREQKTAITTACDIGLIYASDDMKEFIISPPFDNAILGGDSFLDTIRLKPQNLSLLLVNAGGSNIVKG